jgi:hypothetical protein
VEDLGGVLTVCSLRRTLRLGEGPETPPSLCGHLVTHEPPSLLAARARACARAIKPTPQRASPTAEGKSHASGHARPRLDYGTCRGIRSCRLGRQLRFSRMGGRARRFVQSLGNPPSLLARSWLFETLWEPFGLCALLLARPELAPRPWVCSVPGVSAVTMQRRHWLGRNVGGFHRGHSR